ncbi:hypothetical protein E6W39_01275 [Kitasatospora acidiphila]|uniref:Uncharacterized protein n=1 Tax=Kitasatospora acidiphila TaxID=2567942 RepID=A0A540VWN8_9ACTN|nr:hypothetical protein [Kitasatospora acidiphila]TQF01117.1 hypothetical protein E6W39_01275 [Kitasatospora acidiphila]
MAEDAGREPVAVLWAFVVREATQGSPFAQAFVEIEERRYGELLDDALSSGFELAGGDPPSTSAAVLVREEQLVELALAGGHRGWTTAEPPLLSADWLAAAASRQLVVVVLLPPGTMAQATGAPMPADPAPGIGADAFMGAVDRARSAGRVFHGIARLMAV